MFRGRFGNFEEVRRLNMTDRWGERDKEFLQNSINGYHVQLTGIIPKVSVVNRLIMKNKILFALTLLMFAFACDDADNAVPEKHLC